MVSENEEHLILLQRVTPWNVDKLRRAIINGAEIHPGAINYKDKDQMYKLQSGRITRMSIARKLPTSRGAHPSSGKGPESEYDGKIVSRHVRDGDVVLVNRQVRSWFTTLHLYLQELRTKSRNLGMHFKRDSHFSPKPKGPL